MQAMNAFNFNRTKKGKEAAATEQQQPPQHLIDLGRDLRENERMSREKMNEKKTAGVSHNEPHSLFSRTKTINPADY